MRCMRSNCQLKLMRENRCKAEAPERRSGAVVWQSDNQIMLGWRALRTVEGIVAVLFMALLFFLGRRCLGLPRPAR